MTVLGPSTLAQSSTDITFNQAMRGGKVVDLKRTVDQAVQNCPSVQQVLVAMRTENTVAMTDRDVPLEEVGQETQVFMIMLLLFIDRFLRYFKMIIYC